MKIAFWSEDGQSGTTSYMLASAAMVSILCPQVEISVQSLGAPGNPIADIYFLDCGAGMDALRRQAFKQMDMVVVNLKQEKEALDRFVLEEIHGLPDFLVLLGNYYENSQFNREYLEYVYRIAPESVGTLSHNSEFVRVCEDRKIGRFVRREYRRAKTVRNEQLLKELETFSRQIIKKYEEQYQGGR